MVERHAGVKYRDITVVEKEENRRRRERENNKQLINIDVLFDFTLYSPTSPFRSPCGSTELSMTP
jgi:hypothetical protein